MGFLGNNDHGEDSELGHDQLAKGGAFAWMDHGPLVALVYSIGDLNCHQKYERAFMINGNQTAVCARDIGILFGFVVGALAWSRFGLNRYSIRDSFLSLCRTRGQTAISYGQEADSDVCHIVC